MRLNGEADPAAAAPARELVALVLDLHGIGLARLMADHSQRGRGRNARGAADR